MRKSGFALVLIGLMFMVSQASAAILQLSSGVLHVGKLSGDYPTIEAAIDASVNGDTIIVRNGTYKGTGNRKIHFDGKAITLRSANGPKKCIIDANDGAQVFGFATLKETCSSVISGFTITKGKSSSPYFWTGCDGSGIALLNIFPTINNCIFVNNNQT